MKQSSTESLAILSLLILLSACIPAQVQVLPTQTKIVVAEPTDTLESKVVSTQIATAISTATPEPACPTVNPDLQFNLPKESNEVEGSILKYLNAGGDPVQ